jgi:hypothetical protein
MQRHIKGCHRSPLDYRPAGAMPLPPLTVCCAGSEGLWPLAYALLAVDREARDKQHINDVE